VVVDLKAPSWMKAPAIASLSRGYLQDGENIEEMYRRISRSAAQHLNMPELEDKFFDYSYNKGWLCFSTPILANLGTKRGLPISCFGGVMPDSLQGISETYQEAMMLTKGGGGLSCDMSLIRAKGASIANNGESGGIVPWAKIMDSIILGTAQGSTRRGAQALYLSVDHPDIKDFLKIRLPKGDVNRQCLNIHQAVVVSDHFMVRCKNGDPEALALWQEILYTRMVSGEPYIMFEGNAQIQDPLWYKDKGLSTKQSNLCSEIFLHTDEEHTFVCCLSSLNLALWDDWKDTDLVETAIFFLDGVMEEFIQKANGKPGFDRAVRFAEKSRALGLGVLGWHTLLQKKMIAFDSLQATFVNCMAFKAIREQADAATLKLGSLYGEPEWLKGTGRRNSHLLAVAPTATNSIIAGGVSPGIEPIDANLYAHNTAKGNFIMKNPQLELLLEAKGKNTPAVWDLINSSKGSVQSLDFLTDEEKAVFLTAREINQFALIKLAGDRQPYIDQGQSLNLFFSYPDDDAMKEDPTLIEQVAQYIHEVHKMAYDVGLKSLYYLKSEGAAKGDVKIRKESECEWCQG
jgi:ribonucleoside-diphosphate reductase alpha chain